MIVRSVVEDIIYRGQVMMEMEKRREQWEEIEIFIHLLSWNIQYQKAIEAVNNRGFIIPIDRRMDECPKSQAFNSRTM